MATQARRALLSACARLGGGATTTMSMSTKATTGIVGLKVLDDAHNAYASKVREVLKAVRVGIPADAGYRQVVEQVYEGHLKALELARAGSVAQLAAAMAATAQPQWAVPAQSTRQAAPCRPSRSYALRPF